MIQARNSEELSFKEQEQSFDYDLQSYYVIGPLGRGACGFVYKIENFKNKQQFALKVIDKKEKNYKFIEDRLKKEIKIQQELDHPNIIRLIKHFEDEQNYYLLMELGINGELSSYLKERGTLSDQDIVDITFQLANGLKYLHDKDIIHRDLKLQNILLSKEVIKIADFGLSTKISDDCPECSSLCGTPNYISPEIVNNQAYGKKTDIWSFGCILYALCTGQPPFMGDSAIKTIQNVKDGNLKLPSSISPHLKDLLLNTINWDCRKRFTIEQVIAHKFYSSKHSQSIIIFSQEVEEEDNAIKTHKKKTPSKIPLDWTSPRFNGISATESPSCSKINSSSTLAEKKLQNEQFSTQNQKQQQPQQQQHRRTPSNKENLSSVCNILQESFQCEKLQNSKSQKVFSMTAREITNDISQNSSQNEKIKTKSTQKLVNYLASQNSGQQQSTNLRKKQGNSNSNNEKSSKLIKEVQQSYYPVNIYKDSSFLSQNEKKVTREKSQRQDKQDQSQEHRSQDKISKDQSLRRENDSNFRRDKTQQQNREQNQNANIKASRSVSYLESSQQQYSVPNSSRISNNMQKINYQSQHQQSQQSYLQLKQPPQSYFNLNTRCQPNGYSSLNASSRIQTHRETTGQFGESIKRNGSEIIQSTNQNKTQDRSKSPQITINEISQDQISLKNYNQFNNRNGRASELIPTSNKTLNQQSRANSKSFSHQNHEQKETQRERISRGVTLSIDFADNKEQAQPLQIDLSPTSHLTQTYTKTLNIQPLNNKKSYHSSSTQMLNENQEKQKEGANFSPLSTKGLKANRVSTKNGFIEILENNWLSIECQNGALIFRISPDGLTVQIEKSQKSKSQTKEYTLDTLPEKYLKLYSYAKVVCATLKSKIPVVKINNQYGAFMLMSNKPKQNYEAHLITGHKVYHTIGTDRMQVKDSEGNEYIIKLGQQSNNFPSEVTVTIKLALNHLTDCLQKQNEKYLANFN